MLSDPDVRPTAEEVLQNSWVKDLAPNSNESILKLNPSSLKTYGNASKFEKAVATFICSRLKDEDVEHLKEVFMAIDKNGDGHLSLEEMIEGMSKVGFDKKQVEDLFKEIDTDKSGAVDYTGKQFLIYRISFKHC